MWILLKKYKPAPETYEYAAKALSVNTNDIILIAAHGWDVTGASHAGLHTCFIAREGQALYALAPKPSVIGDTILQAAKEIIRQVDSNRS